MISEHQQRGLFVLVENGSQVDFKLWYLGMPFFGMKHARIEIALDLK
jgi:hypothetical protein